MGRDDGIRAAPRAGLAEIVALRDQVERVGIEHAGDVACQRGAKQRFGALALAKPGTDNQSIQVESERLVRVAQHEFQRAGVESRCIAVQEPDENLSRSELQRCAAGEERRAAHSRRASDDRHASGPAFVKIARPRLQRVRHEFRPGDPPGRRKQGAHVEPEVRDMDFAAQVGSVERKQSGLMRNEGQRMRSAHGAAQHAAAVGGEAAGNI